jgi:hypothetical protein
MMFILAAGKVNHTEYKAYCPITVLHAENDAKTVGQPYQAQTNKVCRIHLYQFAYKRGNLKETAIYYVITHTASSRKQGRYTVSGYILREFSTASHIT